MSIKEWMTRVMEKFKDLQDRDNTIESGLPKIGRYTQITLPYTTPSDGFIRIYLNPSSTNSAYIIVTSDLDGTMRVNSTLGMAEFVAFPVMKGSVISYTAGGNVGSYTVHFRPLIGGGCLKALFSRLSAVLRGCLHEY